MFCPTCGGENTGTRKYCITCGTNLEIVSQALSGHKLSWFTRIDMGMDHLLARYAEHIFEDAPAQAIDRKVSNSWKVLGKSVTTSLVDFFMSMIMWNLFTVRFYVLLLSTPFRLVVQRSKRRKLKKTAPQTGERSPEAMPEAPPARWLPGSVASITEYTTERLQEYRQAAQDRSSEKD